MGEGGIFYIWTDTESLAIILGVHLETVLMVLIVCVAFEALFQQAHRVCMEVQVI